MGIINSYHEAEISRLEALIASEAANLKLAISLDLPPMAVGLLKKAKLATDLN